MTADQHQQEIKELYLSRSKFTHKVQDRIELYQTLIDQAEKYSLPAYAACFRGYLAWIKKDFGQALSHFQEAARIDEALPYPWNGLGNVYSDLKEYDQAKQCYEKAIELDETWAGTWNGLGLMYNRLKKYEKAKKYYEKAIELDETWAYPWHGLGGMYYNLKKNAYCFCSGPYAIIN